MSKKRERRAKARSRAALMTDGMKAEMKAAKHDARVLKAVGK